METELSSATASPETCDAAESVPGLFQRSSDGLWIGRVSLPDDGSGRRRYRQVAAKDRATAAERLGQLRDDVDAGRAGAAVRHSVASWVGYWLDEIHAEVVRPSTLRNYRSLLAHHITPVIGSRRLDQLSAVDIRRMHRSIENSCTAVAAHRLLRRSLADAVREGVLPHNVADNVHEPRHTTTARDALSAEQAAQLLAHLRDTGSPWLLRWSCAFLLGARQGEVLGTRWDHVDLDAEVVDLEWQLQALPERHGCGDADRDGKWPCRRKRARRCPDARLDVGRGFEHHLLVDNLALTRPKTRAGKRVVPIIPELSRVFAADAARDDPATNPHRLVFHRGDGRPLTAAADRRNWHQALRSARLPTVPLHSARHTCATILMDTGVDEATRMELLGHVSVTVHRGYAHIGTARKHQAMRGLTGLLVDSTDRSTAGTSHGPQ